MTNIQECQKQTKENHNNSKINVCQLHNSVTLETKAHVKLAVL